MARSSKPRKAYRPKFERGQLPISIRFSGNDGLYLHIAPREALENMRTGRGREDDWSTLAARLNWGAVASKRFDGDGEAVMQASLEALLSIKERADRLFAWGMNGDEYRAMTLGLDCCEQIDAQCTRREMRDDLNFVLAENEKLRAA